MSYHNIRVNEGARVLSAVVDHVGNINVVVETNPNRPKLTRMIAIYRDGDFKTNPDEHYLNSVLMPAGDCAHIFVV